MITVETPATSKPLVLAESANIIEYITEHFGPSLIPKRYAADKEGQVGGETEEWLRYRFFMHHVEGSLMVYLLVGFLVSRTCPVNATPPPRDSRTLNSRAV